MSLYECQCTPSETLGVLFKQTFGRGTKEEIAAALNLTDFFIYQSMAVVTANFDTGNHNYVSAATACRSHFITSDAHRCCRQYLLRESAESLWRPVFYDADWGWGSKFGW